MMTAREIAALLGAPLEGDSGLEILGGNALALATESEIAFVEGKEAHKAAGHSRAGCLLIATDAVSLPGRTLIRVPSPRNAFARVLRTLYPPVQPEPGVHPTAVVAESAVLGDGVSVGPCSVIGESVRIGANSVIASGVWVGDGATIGSACRLLAGARIYPGVFIGDRVTLHAGCVVGADGFGYAFEEDHYEKFPQIGTVQIGDDVEIGANSCVDRGALGATVIGDGTKLDNLVHVAHNCRIGKHVVLAAQTGISGGVVIEDYVVAGGQVGISEKAQIGARAVLGAQCGILPSRRIAPGEIIWGTPARPKREHLESLARLGRLPRIMAQLESLAKRVSELEAE